MILTPCLKPLQRRAAFTAIELLVLCLVLTLFFVFLLYRFSAQFRRPNEMRCVNNLKNLGMAARIFTSGNNGLSPIEKPAPTNPPPADIGQFFTAFAKEMRLPKMLVCPADPDAKEATHMTKLAPKNISYFANVTGGPLPFNAFLFGDNHLQTGGGQALTGKLTVSSNTPLAWRPTRHNRKGAIAMNDGSVIITDDIRLRRTLADQGSFTNVLLIR